ncbi:hypothetical protein ACFVYC_05440 [Pseudarthrobacter sp. NPDC058329]|uniref:hypothetical protein n=1 Tax=Pseudarthrobacter sp. NPDC058329 TaxID=3346448 RepID=UPI0036D7D307
MSDTAGFRRDGSVDQLLLEAGLDGDTGLRPVLLEMQALGSVAPEPTAELLALMAGGNGLAGAGTGAGAYAAAAAEHGAPAEQTAPAEHGAPAPQAPVVTAMQAAAAHVEPAEAPPEPAEAPADELAARRRAKRRVTLTAFSVAVSLSAGGAVAAASDQAIRNSFTQLNQAVTSFITGSGGAPADDQAKHPAAPLPSAPAVGPPAGSSPGDPASIPADPAAATHPTAGPPSGTPAAEGSATSQPTSPGKPGEVPASETLPGAVPGPIAEELGGSPEVPVPSQVPLPPTLPAIPLP